MTLNQVIEKSVQCPYCWERFTILIDASIEQQEYVEDCEVCCRPIDFDVQLDELDRLSIQVRHQDE
jgi:hypothetical protein